ncbi:uncharacterized protein LOC133191331 [Saccostrea echinata]|uniref:uncharacterized protein LOC133191331 n=1 Tax=Saccostrea echinata TaxID=191078 RepID=UPI002A83DA18|nr:uncharacterized protein LOC133191331 [Saccostrea echinata]
MTSLFWGGVIVVNKTYGDKIRALFNQRQQDDIRKENYDDIRESRMMLKTSDGSNSVAPLHRMTAGSCPRGSDNYHHLISTKVIPKQLHSNVYNAKLKQTEDQSCNKLSKTDITDDYFTLVKKESNNA